MSITDDPVFSAVGSVTLVDDVTGADLPRGFALLELSPEAGPHLVSNQVTFLAQFRDAAGADVDPARVIFRAGPFDGAVSTLEFGIAGAVTKTATGRYSCAFTPSARSQHRVRAAGTGANASAAEAQFSVT